MGTAISDYIVALARVVCAICRDATNFLVLRDLVEKGGEDRRIADVTPGDLDSPDLQRFLVDPKVDLTPVPPFGATVLACVRAIRLHLRP